MWTLLKIIFGLVWLTITTFLILILIKIVSPTLDKKLHETISFPQAYIEFEKTLVEKYNIGQTTSLGTNPYLVEGQTDSLRCKFSEPLEKKEGLDKLLFSCNTDVSKKELFDFWIYWVAVPKPDECGYDLVEEYFTKTLKNRHMDVNIMWELNKYKYAYFLFNWVNINHELLTRWLWVYLEQGQYSEEAKILAKLAYEEKKWIYSKCNVTNYDKYDGSHKFN